MNILKTIDKEVRSIKSRTQRIVQNAHPLSKIPEERMKAMREILYDRSTVTVYCDSSAIKDHPIIGLAACFVGDGNTLVKSQKVYLEQMSENILAELKAISYALELLPSVMEKYVFYLDKPRKAIVYSDYQPIDYLLENHQFKKESYADAIEQIKSIMQKLSESYNWLEVKVQYLGEDTLQNLYYKAAHKAARKVIGKK